MENPGNDSDDFFYDDSGEWDVAAADMMAREGAWEDNGCRTLDGHEEL